ncbi:MAG: right-handed parallel beta-helix repeat-containing protein [Akkermansiaceae bacterium]|jgi:hypothetical protein|nr:right-handed parallel beta-helix repeat-containing protein [Akkermansiaceae bacterium]
MTLHHLPHFPLASILRPLLAALLCLLAVSCDKGTQIYVSPSGSDANDGSRGHPFATLEHARDAARGATSKPVTIWIGGGTYEFPEGFQLDSADSGTADHPVTYRAMEGETPVFTGARRVPPGNLKKVTDPATLARIRANAREHVLALDIDKFGVVHSRRLPDVFRDFGGIADLYFDGQRMTLARFPNKGWMTFRSVLHTAGGPQGDWKDTQNVQKLPPGATGGIFEYREEFADRHALWKKQLHRGVWLRGYWRVAWENSALRVLDIDDAKRTATFAKPIHNGIGNKYTRPRGNGREAYQLINLLEEIDEPGEWCMDFQDRCIYLWPPSEVTESSLRIADSDTPLIRIKDARHIVLRDIVIDTHLGHGIEVSGGSHVLVAGCTVRNVNRNAINLNGGSHHEARSNDLYQLGGGGIWLAGGDATTTPRTPAGHRAINNHIHHFARIEPVYAAGINSGFTGGGGGGHHTAVGMHVAHNLIHDTPHVGVLCGSMDSVFEFNEVSRYCLVSNDMGAFYSYDFKNRQFGNLTFRHNLVHSSPLGDGIYFDHDHPDMKIIGNIVALGSTGTRGTAYLFKQGDMVKDGLTQPFDCVGNIAMDCKVGFEFVTIPPHQGQIRDNIAVNCRTPFRWRQVKNNRTVDADPYPTGPHAAFAKDPGFRNASEMDYRLNADSAVFREVPGFENIPVEKIGLFIDEFRTQLPDPASAGRVAPDPQDAGLGYDILDRRD